MRLFPWRKKSIFTALKPVFQFTNWAVNWTTQSMSNYIDKGYLINPDLYSIINFITSKSKAVEWYIYKETPETRKALTLPINKRHKAFKQVEKVNVPEIEKVLRQPNESQNYSQFIEQVIGMKKLTGNVYIYKETPENGMNRGKAIALYVLPSQYMSIELYKEGGETKKKYVLNYNSKQEYRDEEILHLRTWSPVYTSGQYLYGLSPLQSGWKSVEVSNSTYDAMKTAFDAGGVKGIISGGQPIDGATVTEEQLSSIKESWERKKTNPIIWTSAALNWQNIGLSPTDMALIDSQNYNIRTMCNLYQVNPIIFTGDNTTYNNLIEAKRSAYTDAIKPDLEEFWDAILPFISPALKGYKIEGEWMELPEFAADIVALSSALAQAWWLTANEKREAMGYEESDNQLMNEYIAPVGLMPLGEDAESKILGDDTRS